MAEEKVADRPQILKGDIVRFISALTGEENVEVVRCENTEAYFSLVGEVLAVYRFDGKGFGGIWQDEEAIERYKKEAGDSSHGSEETN